MVPWTQGGTFFQSFYFLESSEDGTPTQCRGHKLVLGREEAALPNPITHWPPNDIALGSCVWTSFWEIDSLIPSTPDTWRTATSPGRLPCRAQLCPTEHGCQEVSHMWNTYGRPTRVLGAGQLSKKGVQHHVSKTWTWTLQGSHLFPQAGETQGHPSYS